MFRYVLEKRERSVPLGKILAQQAIGVLVAAALPRAAWIAEIDLHVSGDGEVLVISHLLAAASGRRLAPQQVAKIAIPRSFRPVQKGAELQHS